MNTQRWQAHSGAVYRITVKGHLETSWGERLAGMKVMPKEDGDFRRSITVLEGRVRDQAELSGVLNTLCELHLPLLCVEVVEEKLEPER